VFVAWGDESGSVRDKDPDAYLMSGVIAEQEVVQDLRDAMRMLLLSSEKKVHWRGDTEKRHDAVINTIGTLPVESIVVVRLSGPGEKDERKRRKCFETYIPALVDLGCSHLTLESRGPHDDRRDMAMLDALRASRRVDSALRLEHAPGPADPALWIADAVCGAVVSHRIGQPRWLKALERQVDVEIVDDRPQT
jgi:hypothetical protein